MVPKLLDLVRKEYPSVVLDMRETSKLRKEKNNEAIQEMTAVMAHVDARNNATSLDDSFDEDTYNKKSTLENPTVPYTRNDSLKPTPKSGPFDIRRSSFSL